MSLKNRSARQSYLALAAVLVSTIWAYLPSLKVPFQFDDYARIVGNELLQRGETFAGIAWMGNARLIPATTLALNFLWGGDDTLGYHIVNLVVHLLATVGVFRLCLLLCRSPRLQGASLARQSLVAATAAALFFGCHPVQTQAVTYIVQRVASMATMFYVWSVVLYVSGRNQQVCGDRTGARRRYVACGALAACAVLSKENAASLPVMLVLTELTFYGGRSSLRNATRFGLLALLIVGLPVIGKIFEWRARWPGGHRLSWAEQAMRAVFAQGMGAGQAVAPFDYFLTQLTVVPRYLGLVVMPWGLNVDHDVAVQHDVSGWVVGGFAFLATLAVVGVYSLRRWPLVGFGIVWFFIAISIESSFIPIIDMLMEHRIYLAMPGIALVAASFFALMFERRSALASALGMPIAVLLCTLTFMRNQVWQTPVALWSDAASKSPRKARVHVNVGVAYHGEGRLDDAIRHYCIALELDPEIAIAEENIEVALDQQGRLDEMLSRANPKPVSIPRAPPGAIVLEYDLAEIVCADLNDGR